MKMVICSTDFKPIALIDIDKKQFEVFLSEDFIRVPVKGVDFEDYLITLITNKVYQGLGVGSYSLVAADEESSALMLSAFSNAPPFDDDARTFFVDNFLKAIGSL